MKIQFPRQFAFSPSRWSCNTNNVRNGETSASNALRSICPCMRIRLGICTVIIAFCMIISAVILLWISEEYRKHILQQIQRLELPIPWTATGNETSSSSLHQPFIVLITGLLVDRSVAWNPGARPSERGEWLLDSRLDGITKHVFDSDHFLNFDMHAYFKQHSENHFAPILNDSNVYYYTRWHNETWQQHYLPHLLHRPNIELIPCANFKGMQESGYYLLWILNNYDRLLQLPEIIIFTHGNPRSHVEDVFTHIQWFKQMLLTNNTNGQFFSPENGFLHLNCQIYLHRVFPYRAYLNVLNLTDPVNDAYFPAESPLVKCETYCCAQFIVHRSRILQRPKWFWQMLLKLTMDTAYGNSFNEHVWHFYFGEPLTLDPQKNLATLYERDHPHEPSKCQWKTENLPPQYRKEV